MKLFNRSLVLRLLLGLIVMVGISYFAQSVYVTRVESRLEQALATISAANHTLDEAVLNLRDPHAARHDRVVSANRLIAESIEALRREQGAVERSVPAFAEHVEALKKRSDQRSELSAEILAETASLHSSLRAISVIADKLVATTTGDCAEPFQGAAVTLSRTVESYHRLALLRDARSQEAAGAAKKSLQAAVAMMPAACGARLDKLAKHAHTIDLSLGKLEAVSGDFSQGTEHYGVIVADRTAYQRANREWFGLLMLLCIGVLSAMVLFLFRDVARKSEQLEKANVTLEERVARRTAELAEAVAMAEAATEAKSSFLARMSHEIRTPLNGVIGMTELLSRTQLRGMQRTLLDAIGSSGAVLLEIVTNVLDLSKLEVGQLSVEEIAFDVRTLIDDIIDMFTYQAEEKGLSLRSDIPAGLSTIRRGDPVRMRQIIVNLVANALKFTSEGEVRVRLSEVTDPELDEKRLRFEVIDTGIGLDSETCARIFDEFTQADESTTRVYGGTGLGLSIVKQLTHLMGGELGVRSDLGSGSTFWVEVALERAEEDELEQVVQEPSLTSEQVMMPVADHPHRRVLLAEDNHVNQQVQMRMLELLGCEVTLAEDGAIAVELAQEGDFDMIFMDARMPNMDGLEATRRIRKSSIQNREGERIPIVALTANAYEADRQECLTAGMDDFVSKPIRIAILEELLAIWSPAHSEPPPPSSTSPEELRAE